MNFLTAQSVTSRSEDLRSEVRNVSDKQTVLFFFAPLRASHIRLPLSAPRRVAENAEKKLMQVKANQVVTAVSATVLTRILPHDSQRIS